MYFFKLKCYEKMTSLNKLQKNQAIKMSNLLMYILV